MVMAGEVCGGEVAAAAVDVIVIGAETLPGMVPGGVAGARPPSSGC